MNQDVEERGQEWNVQQTGSPIWFYLLNHEHSPRAKNLHKRVSITWHSSAPKLDYSRVQKEHGFHTHRMMRVFVTHRNKALTHRELLRAVWGCLRLLVNQLPKKIEPKTQPPPVETNVYEIFSFSSRMFYAHAPMLRLSVAPFMI